MLYAIDGILNVHFIEKVTKAQADGTTSQVTELFNGRTGCKYGQSNPEACG